MKIDYIIGNPPYQDQNEDSSWRDFPIYHKFVEKAKRLNPHFMVFIIPARWYISSTGDGMGSFIENMINDNHIIELHDWQDSKEVFPTVNIQGGICYFLRDSMNELEENKCKITMHSGDKSITVHRELNTAKLGKFIRNEAFVKIINIVQPKCESLLFNEIAKNPYRITTNFSTDYEKSALIEPIKVIGKFGGSCWIEKSAIERGKDELDKYRVVCAESGSGDFNTPNLVTGKPFILNPGEACTETYLRIWVGKSLEECKNVVEYLKSKFVRALIFMLKPSQHIGKQGYKLVPIMDFQKAWSDPALYEYFELNNLIVNEYTGQTAAEFIENIIKEIE